MSLEGGSGLSGAVTGDKALLDMGKTEDGKKFMRNATKATGKKWLSQVVSASGRTVLAYSGVNDRQRWKDVVMRGIKTMGLIH